MSYFSVDKMEFCLWKDVILDKVMRQVRLVEVQICEGSRQASWLLCPDSLQTALAHTS